MDFYRIAERVAKNGEVILYPDFLVGKSQDLMVRAKSFYAIWDEAVNLWSTDELDVARLVDEELYEYHASLKAGPTSLVRVASMRSYGSRSWKDYRQYIASIPDSKHQLDETLTFANTDVKKSTYASRRLPYSLEPGDISAYDELISTLYDPGERAKIEWAIGAIIAGDAKNIQKFCVLYGDAGTGKSTVLNIIQMLFQGYYTAFEAKALTSSSNAFSTEVFKSNPLVAIQHDGDLSRIEDNTKLNSIVSHEEIVINEKYKPGYMARVNCFLFMGTNKPVKITDAKSGIIRRLIDIRPTGDKVPVEKYHILMSQIHFELGAIANHCLSVYREMGKNYYNAYRPIDMMMKTDVFFNFVEEHYDVFKEEDGITLSRAYILYKEYCDDALVDFKLPLYKFREELKNYFDEFHDRTQIGQQRLRSYYKGFSIQKFQAHRLPQTGHAYSLVLENEVSLLDDILADCPAQYASAEETPTRPWDEVTTTLSEIETKELHYVRPPENHIVIDFDLRGDDGEKSFEKNAEAASKWPSTYSELSKSGEGIHLHYNYQGDASELSRVYADGIEIKVFTGKSSLRRKVIRCNNVPVANIESGLPLKEKTVLSSKSVMSERSLREQILKNLRKEVHPGTKPSIDFIKKILDDAYSSGLKYDVSDMRSAIIVFATNSTHQAQYCMQQVTQMKFASEETTDIPADEEKPLVFFDVEVFPNLFVVCWKAQGKPTVRMINPTPDQIEELTKYRLVGFYNRQYDNHILYGRLMGYNNEQLYKQSQLLINGETRGAGKFGEAYGLSYTDVYDFSSKKQTLKKFEIELGLKHQELPIPWDQPVPDDMIELVAEYCENDVIATEATFEARHDDFVARQILADLSGLTVNESTQQHTARIVFGKDKNPQEKFVYTKLDTLFPGYTYDFGKSSYRGENPGEGGYVYSEPGMYENVALLDVASMHPNSIRELNLFGPYTKNFTDLVDARLAIKNKDFDTARTLLNGALAPYITDEENSEKLSYALKIVINIVYGLTSAKFDNKFRDIRNVDNIVAKRGGLFMIDLKHEVQARGFTVAHIKTDSIKIPNATPEIIEFVKEFGAKYGYTFEHESTFEKFCLVNDAVYVAKVATGKHAGQWEAVGAQFKEPYVFKTLFSGEEIVFDDFCITKAVTTALYLDMNEGLPEDEHNYVFVGKIGQFTPVISGVGGGELCRVKDGKFYSATGAKGWRWKLSETIKQDDLIDEVDKSYFEKLVNDAVEDIGKFGDVEWFTA